MMEQWFFAAVLAVIGGLILSAALLAQARARSRACARNINTASRSSMRDLFAGNGPAGWPPGGSRRLAQKIIILRELRGPVIMGPGSLAGEDVDQMSARARRALAGHGFTEEEAAFLADLLQAQVICADDAEVDPRAIPAAPPISTTDARTQLLNAAGQGYPKALIINTLLASELITRVDLTEAIHALSAMPLALLWDALARRLVNLAQDRAMLNIRAGRTEAGSQGRDVSVAFQALPPTPEARLLCQVLDSGVVSGPEVAAMARRCHGLVELAMAVVEEKIARPIFEVVLALGFARVQEEPRELVFQSVLAELHPHLFRDPLLVRDVADGDLAYNPCPVNRAIEPTTLRELVLLKLLQLNPSQTGGHSLGQLCSIWPFTLHVVREALGAADAGGDARAVVGVIDHHVNVFIPLVASEVLDKYQHEVTERDVSRPRQEGDLKLLNVFSDQDLYDLFERAALGSKGLEEVLAETAREPRAGCPGRLAEVLARCARDRSMGPLARALDRAEVGRDELAALLKEATLGLAERWCPAAARLDRATGRRLTGLGLIPLYLRRLALPLFRPERFWGIYPWTRKVGLLATMALAALLGVWLIPWHLGAGLTVIISAIFIPPVLWGRTRQPGEKAFWTCVFSSATFYVFGVLVHHLFFDVAVIQFASWGFALTAGVVLLCFVPMLIAMYHCMTALWSYAVLRRELWSKRARSLVGLRSLFRPLGVDWTAFFRSWYGEFLVTEQRHMALTPAGEPVGRYLERLVNDLHSRYLLSAMERGLWVAALRDQANGKMVKPASPKAFDILYSAFFALSQKKTAAGPISPVAGHLDPCPGGRRDLHPHVRDPGSGGYLQRPPANGERELAVRLHGPQLLPRVEPPDRSPGHDHQRQVGPAGRAEDHRRVVRYIPPAVREIPRNPGRAHRRRARDRHGGNPPVARRAAPLQRGRGGVPGHGHL